MNKIELLTLLSVQVCSSLLCKNKISKLALIKPKFSSISVTNADCSYNWKKKTQHIFRCTSSVVCWTWKLLLNDTPSFCLPSWCVKRYYALDKLCLSNSCTITVTAMVLPRGRDYPPQSVSLVSCAYQNGSPAMFRGTRREERFHYYSHKTNIR